MSPSLWGTMLEQNQWDMISIRDARYDLVVHLVSAADGAKCFYSLESNKCRTESAEDAIQLDKRTQNAWVGHPHLRIVDNRTDFRQKINRIDARISELAGIHLSKRVIRKFLLSNAVDAFPHNAEQFCVEQTFLSREQGNDVQESVRKRGSGSFYTFVHKIRRGEAETKRQITNREFLSLLAHCDPQRRTVKIRRRCFLYNGNYFVLDCITNLEPCISMLRCHFDEGEEDPGLPEWVHVDKEVTGEKDYTIHKLSKRITKIRIRSDETRCSSDRLTDLDMSRSY